MNISAFKNTPLMRKSLFSVYSIIVHTAGKLGIFWKILLNIRRKYGQVTKMIPCFDSVLLGFVLLIELLCAVWTSRSP